MALLPVTKRLHVTPLIDIESDIFRKWYVNGLRWQLFGWRDHGGVQAQGPLPESYLINSLKMCAQRHRFDGQHEEGLREDLGFLLGMLHGGVLTPNGTFRPDATTLVIIRKRDFRSGYERGRRHYFTRYDEITHTENDLLDVLRGCAEEKLYEEKNRYALQWAIGCTAGELSGRLFPMTKGEQDAWASLCPEVATIPVPFPRRANVQIA